jgi:two-component system response regulator
LSSQFEGLRTKQILLVEDNENDAELTRIAFKKSKLLFNLHHVWDGEECMAFLRKQDPHAGVPTPDLVLLDLNMPRMDGREVMAAIVADGIFRSIPVVILTTSADDREVFRMYQLRCNSYIVKPVDLQEFLQVAQSLSDYWFGIVVLPTARGES